MIDRDLVMRKLTLILSDLEILRILARKPKEEYLHSAEAELAAERLLERLIGRMIDINYHVTVESGQAPPSDYHASFIQLGKQGVLPPDFAREIASAAGLRNRIVHEYEEVDPERIHEALQRAVRDVPRYVELVRRHVEAVEGDQERR